MNARRHIEETTRAQQIAASPANSVFVSANAGSGKTRVLTNRVARLLLDGVDPSTILCITFTKAAAAEMADRLYNLLGGWALAEDAPLQEALAALGGATEQAPTQEALARARRLFARALETPGGLKIQTIHSFCESLLRRFPLEAGIAPGFAVIDELETSRLAQEAVAHAATMPVAAAAFAHLLKRMSGHDLRSHLENALTNDRRKFSRALRLGARAAAAETAAALGVSPNETAHALTQALIAAMPRARMTEAFAALDASGGNPQKYCAAPLRIFLDAADNQARLEALTSLFLTTSGDPREKFGTAKTAAINPEIEPFLKDRQAHFVAAIDKIRAAEAASDTAVFLTLLDAAHEAFERRKRAGAALDFDDLIYFARNLLGDRASTQWVLYKLDKGVNHILLDEAQDTSPDAWDVIERPLEEFFAGAGRTDKTRTFFAVGDKKQSIYSFQGADAALFKQKEAELGKKISAASAYRQVPLKASFRTSAPVLQFVDALFARREVVENVSDESPLEHFCTREGAAGLVELWPLVTRDPAASPDPWDAPLDAVSREAPAKKLASEVAATIKGWLIGDKTLASQGRPITPGDIMILVQNRGQDARRSLFGEMIRALGVAGVPVAGADKFKLSDDQGVRDLISYARAVLLESDDLSLAEILKSPFFNFDEEALYDLASARGAKSIWAELIARQDERAPWRAAQEEIARARQAANEGAVAFFTHILECGDISGWRRLAERLGPASREPIEEFLRQAFEFERRAPRSLRLFIDAIEASGAEVSRDASESGGVVRVMTVHKAKGLEANIVFLLDAHRMPPSKAGFATLLDGANGALMPAIALGEAKKCAAMMRAQAQASRRTRDEYRRLLYVAATRARDRLYICGFELGNKKDPHAPEPADKTWHALSEDAFAMLGPAVREGPEKFGGPVLQLACDQAAPISSIDASRQRRPAIAPDFLFAPARAERPFARLSPSRLASAKLRTPDEPVYSPTRSKEAYRRGRAIHRLLELLPRLDANEQRRAAARFVHRQSPAFSPEAAQEIVDEAMRVLEHPEFAPVFRATGQSEVPIGGRIGDGAGLLGQIDRLAILEDRILIVDYKTNRPPPQRAEDIPLAYVAQMAAYRALLLEAFPGRKIATALLWTFEARLMIIPDALLDRAAAMTLA